MKRNKSISLKCCLKSDTPSLDCLHFSGMVFLVMEKEVWKDVIGYEGLYQVSNLGRVKSASRIVDNGCKGLRIKNEMILKGGVNSCGYINVALCMQGKYKGASVHQLVAVAFLNHTPCGHKIVVDHINGDKLDNRAGNLQLITQRENTSKDKFKYNSSSKYTGVYLNKGSNRWRAIIYIDGKLKHLGMFSLEINAYNAYLKALSHYNIKNKYAQ